MKKKSILIASVIVVVVIVSTIVFAYITYPRHELRGFFPGRIEVMMPLEMSEEEARTLMEKIVRETGGTIIAEEPVLRAYSLKFEDMETISEMEDMSNYITDTYSEIKVAVPSRHLEMW